VEKTINPIKTKSMSQSYFLKNLPTPLHFWVRPMLLLSLGLHGLFLAIPIAYEKKPVPIKKEPEKVKITQLPTTPASPTPRLAVKPTPQVRPSIRPQPTPIRQRVSDIPPIPPLTRSLPLPQSQPIPERIPPQPTATATPPQPTPERTAPQPTATLPQPTPEITPPQSIATPASPQPTPEQTPNSTVQNPFADFPFPANAQSGSLGLLSGENDKSARNTVDGVDQVVAFYNKELPTNKFNFQPITNEADLKVFEVSKDSGTPQYLHLISQDGKTVILLASQQVPDLKSLKNAEARSQEEIAFYDNVLKPLENDEKLILNAVEPDDIAKVPESTKFSDTNKFRALVKTGKLAPKSPQELSAIYEAQLTQNGFTKISKEAPYGGALTYKIEQGKFTMYMYFVVNTDNNTLVLLSKDSPF
jgi:hypothetical protein